MGTILASQTWVTPQDYVIERSLVWGFAFVWWDMCIIQSAPDMIMKEAPFGGYRVRLNVTPSFWAHTGSAWRHDEIFEDMYALAPGSGTPISMGAVNRALLFYPEYKQYVVVVEAVPNDKHHVFWEYPPASENAGLPVPPSGLPAVFFRDPPPAGPIAPPIYC